MPSFSASRTTDPAKPLGSRHRWVVLGVGVAAQASFAAAFAGIPVTGTLLRTAYHLTTGELGVVLAAILLGVAASEIVWGLFTDMFGDRRVLLIGLISTGLVFVVMAVFVVPSEARVPSVWLLAGGLLLVGLLGGSVNSSSGRAVMLWFTDGQRGFAMSVRQTAIPAGGAIGAALLPWLAAFSGFRAVFLVLAGFCLATALATARWLREPREEPNPVGPIAAGDPAQGRSPLVRWDCWRIALASALLTMPQIAILGFAGIYLHDVKHADLIVISATILTVQVGGAVLRVWSGRYTDRKGNRRRFVAVIGLLTGGSLLAAVSLLWAPTVVVALALVVAGILANSWHGVAYTEMAVMAGTSRAGAALGLENTTAFTGAFVTPLLVPLLLAIGSWPLAWTVIAIAPLVAVPLVPRTISAVTTRHD
ncbi:MFS transporter [Rathayibacter rathayi]|nr:MFS transporter [Rathayibacter rathayi]PPG77555.1 MFS transporter [Rathayibacter rathayi]PPG87863.1 MFS transporter [Rathayibacter rathayi]PPH25823.1 MFS transporter [Rathayibacter rathayi]PPI77879.1 MFS transporter [Rathayibacter rathayi]